MEEVKIESQEKNRKEEQNKSQKTVDEKIEKKSEKENLQKSGEKGKTEIKKDEALVRGKDLEISTKHAIAICELIRFKNPEKMIGVLEKVLKLKAAVPFKGEIPHRKKGHRINGKISGRYPVAAAKVFIKLLKNLNKNAEINNMDPHNLKITLAVANKASRPIRPTRIAFGRKRFKRTHVLIVAKEIKQDKQEKSEKKK